MASSPENVKNDLDNATDTTASSQPPPPPYLPPHLPHPQPPSSYPQWLLPNYPSTPPPEYGQIVVNKAYQTSNAIAPYQDTASEADQPQQTPLPPTNVQARESQQMLLLPSGQARSIPSQQVVLIEREAAVGEGGGDHHQGQQSFLTHIVLSCCVFWFCGWMCGGIAFMVALIAQSSAASGDVVGARRLGHLSLGLSICGLIFGTMIAIFVFATCHK